MVARALNEQKTKEELGGAKVHTRNGVVDNIAKDEADALDQIRRFLDYLPLNVWESPPRRAATDDPERRNEALLSLIPRDRRKIFDARRLIAAIVDDGDFFEMGRFYGRGQIIGLARMNGQPVGIMTNDSHYYAGAMTDAGARKVRRFVEFCQTFHLPVITFVDEPGFMIGSESESAGTIRCGTAAVLAVADCVVPLGIGDRAQVVRRGPGGALRAGRLYPRLALGGNGRVTGRRRCRGRLRPGHRCVAGPGRKAARTGRTAGGGPVARGARRVVFDP